MAIQNIGKVFKNKSGKSASWIVSKSELELIMSKMQQHEKYGEQAILVITGSMENEYGYSVGMLVDDEAPQKVQTSSDVLDPDDLPF